MRLFAALAVVLAACYSTQTPRFGGADDDPVDAPASSEDCVGGDGVGLVPAKVCDFTAGPKSFTGMLDTAFCSQLIPQSDNVMLCVVAFDGDITVDDLIIQGPFPLLLATRHAIHISESVTVIAGRRTAPDQGVPGANDPCTATMTATSPGGGGGGGGFQGHGGDGGKGGTAPGQGGFRATTALKTVSSGCSGGEGGNGAGGGPSGGAVYFLARTTIDVNGVIDANGAGGVGGTGGGISANGGGDGGGGGGAGGLVAFEAQALTIMDGSRIVAKGGAGGGGGGDLGAGGPGGPGGSDDGTTVEAPAQGNAGGGATKIGGEGGTGTGEDVIDGGDGVIADGGGGGGGGGAGFVVAYLPTNVDPPPPASSPPLVVIHPR